MCIALLRVTVAAAPVPRGGALRRRCGAHAMGSVVQRGPLLPCTKPLRHGVGLPRAGANCVRPRQSLGVGGAHVEGGASHAIDALADEPHPGASGIVCHVRRVTAWRRTLPWRFRNSIQASYQLLGASNPCCHKGLKISGNRRRKQILGC